MISDYKGVKQRWLIFFRKPLYKKFLLFTKALNAYEDFFHTYFQELFHKEISFSWAADGAMEEGALSEHSSCILTSSKIFLRGVGFTIPFSFL